MTYFYALCGLLFSLVYKLNKEDTDGDNWDI